MLAKEKTRAKPRFNEWRHLLESGRGRCADSLILHVQYSFSQFIRVGFTAVFVKHFKWAPTSKLRVIKLIQNE